MTILGVLGGGTGMNSMEEEATQLESDVLRKILRQPKESAPKKAKDIMRTATPTGRVVLPCLLRPPDQDRPFPGRPEGTKKQRAPACGAPHREPDALPRTEGTAGQRQEASQGLICPRHHLNSCSPGCLKFWTLPMSLRRRKLRGPARPPPNGQKHTHPARLATDRDFGPHKPTPGGEFPRDFFFLIVAQKINK